MNLQRVPKLEFGNEVEAHLSFNAQPKEAVEKVFGVICFCEFLVDEKTHAKATASRLSNRRIMRLMLAVVAPISC